MRAGVEPGKSAAKHLDIEVATLQVGVVDVGDLDLAAGRRLDVGGDVKYAIVVKVEPGYSDIRFRLLRPSARTWRSYGWRRDLPG